MILPLSGCRRRRISLSRVVFPSPLLPNTATVSLLPIKKLTSSVLCDLPGKR
jgi:hypothetical protein